MEESKETINKTTTSLKNASPSQQPPPSTVGQLAKSA